MVRQIKIRSTWEDRFSKPTVQQLLNDVQRPRSYAFSHARALLLGYEGVVEYLAWHGVPWRWSMLYSCGEEKPIAYLIPDPMNPRVTVPAYVTDLAALPIRTIPSRIREGLQKAPEVAGVRWCQWPLESKAAADEILAFIQSLRPAFEPG